MFITFDKIFSKFCLLTDTLSQCFKGKNAADKFQLQALLQHLRQVCENKLMDDVTGALKELHSNDHDHQAEYLLINLNQERKDCYFNAVETFLMGCLMGFNTSPIYQ